MIRKELIRMDIAEYPVWNNEQTEPYLDMAGSKPNT
jgi:hypothetical protein